MHAVATPALLAPGRLVSAAPRLTLDWVRDAYGPEVEGRAIATLHRRYGVHLPDALAGPWVPFGLQLALLEALEQEGFTAHHFQALGRYHAAHVESVLPGAALLLRFASPERLLKAAPLLWRTYADFGAVEAHASGHTGRIALSGIRPTPAYCATLQGLFGGLLERIGHPEAAVEHVQCSCHGGPRCLFEGRWT